MVSNLSGDGTASASIFSTLRPEEQKAKKSGSSAAEGPVKKSVEKLLVVTPCK